MLAEGFKIYNPPPPPPLKHAFGTNGGKRVVGEPQTSQEKASAEIRGEFLRTKSRVNFAGDFLVDFFGPFSLAKK